jgi:hypothetical protein
MVKRVPRSFVTKISSYLYSYRPIIIIIIIIIIITIIITIIIVATTTTIPHIVTL